MEVYEDIFAKCNKPERHVVPSDQNWYKVYQVSKVLLKTFEDMNLKWPQLSPDQETAYLKAKAELEQRTSDEEREKYRLNFEAKQAKKLAKKKEKLEKKQNEKLEEEKKENEKQLAKDTKKKEKKVKEIQSTTIVSKTDKVVTPQATTK